MYSISELIKTGKKLFHIDDLALLWNIDRPGTLHMRIMRYIDNGILFKIQRGLYSVVPLHALSPLEVAVAIHHGYCYLTTETILERHGVINRRIHGLTFVSNTSKTITWRDNIFIFRKLKDAYLFQTTGMLQEGDYFTASLERAVADMIYFQPKFYFDAPGLIDREKVGQMQKEVGYI